MRVVGGRRPNVRRMTRRGDLAGLVEALEYNDPVADRRGHSVDLGVPVRMAAVEALAQSTHPDAVSGLVRALDDDHGGVRSTAIGALRARREDRVTRALVARVASPASPDGEGERSRAEALDALLDTGDPRTPELLVLALVHRDDDGPLDESDASSVAAVLAMSAAAADGVAWRLVPLLGHHRPAVCDRAETCLTWLEGPSVEPLTAALDRPDIRGRAARVLGRLRDNRAVGALTDMVFDHDPAVRCAVVQALGEIKDISAATALLRCSRDDEHGVRVAASRALRGLGAAGTVAAIAELGQSLDAVAGPLDGPRADEPEAITSQAGVPGSAAGSSP